MLRLRRWPGARVAGCVALVTLVASVTVATPWPATAQPAAPTASVAPAATAPASARAPADRTQPRPRVLLYDWGPGAAAEAAQQLGTYLERRGRFTLGLRAEAIARLKASAAGQRALANAAAFTDAGRAAEMSLQWASAEAAYRRAVEALEEAVVRLYEPDVVARLHLALGAVAFHQGQRTLAHDEFRTALSLWPKLEPDRSYNPQVRAAFDVARGKVPPSKRPRGKVPPLPPTPPIPPPPPPTATEVGRLAAMVDVDAVVVVEHEATVGRQALRASLYSAARGAYVAVETRAVATDAPTAEDHEALGGRLTEALDGLFPPPKPPKPPKPPEPPLPPPPPPPPPWYKRWWVWVAVGVVAVTSVSVPVLVLRRDTVTVLVSF